MERYAHSPPPLPPFIYLPASSPPSPDNDPQLTHPQSKLLSAGAKNPYAAYAAKCTGKECITKIESGRKYCNKCAYRANACAVCGKKNAPEKKAAPVIAGQKFTLK